MNVLDMTFFRAFPSTWIDELLAEAEHVALATGARVSAPGVCVLTRGAVRIGTAGVEEGPGAAWGSLDRHTPHVTAVSDGELLRWSARPLDDLERRLPGLREQLRTRLSLRTRRSEIEDLLRKAFLFRDTSLVLVRRVVELSTLVHFDDRDVVCRQGDPGDALFVVVSGEVRIVIDDGSVARSLNVLRPGDCFGEAALLHGSPRMATAVAEGATEILVVGKRAFDALGEQSRGFLRRARALAEERAGAVRTRAPTLVWIENHTELDTEALADFVAQALHADVGEAAALVVVDAAAPAAIDRTRSGVARAVVRTGDVAAEAALRSRPESYLLAFARRPGRDTLRAQPGTELRFLSHGAAPLHHAEKFVHDVWVGRGRRRAAAGDLLLPLEARDASPSIDGHTPKVRAAWSRIARAITRRRVGVALSGGGAWGYGHWALLAGLARAGIPVDVLAGSSIGSVVGAMYARFGLDGKEVLAAMSGRTGIAAALSIVTSWPIEHLVREQIGDADIAEMDPAFLPVAVDIVGAAERVFRSGPLALGVRASCAFPGVYGPAICDGGRFVDGALVNNVPVSALREESCDFVIASSIMPPPAPMEREVHATRIARVWSEVSPFGRIRDVTRALMMLGHSVSRELAGAADVVFAPNLSPYLLNEYGKAREIMAKADEQVGPVIEAAARRYAAL